MSLAAILMQSFLGRGLRDIRGAHLPMWVLVVAAPLSFVWLAIEVGVVEEFFFRVLLQERLAVALRSPWGGLVVAAVLFGLVHAPGFFLRPAATQEGLGSHPSLFMAVGYSIVLTSLAGLFLGVLWMRTKNFAVLVIVHAAGDLLPNLVPWVKAFHLAR
jgi:membrane protease YdiL (CAAX protease family)